MSDKQTSSSANGRQPTLSWHLYSLVLVAVCCACSSKPDQKRPVVAAKEDAQRVQIPAAGDLAGVEVRPYTGPEGQGIVVTAPRSVVARFPFFWIRSRCRVGSRIIVASTSIGGGGGAVVHGPPDVYSVSMSLWTSPPSRCELELFSSAPEGEPFHGVGHLCYAAGRSTHGRCSPGLARPKPQQNSQVGAKIEEVWFHTGKYEDESSLHMNFLATFAQVAHPEWLHVRAACRLRGEIFVTEDPSFDWEIRKPIGIASGDTARLSWRGTWPMLGSPSPAACEFRVIRTRGTTRRVVATFCYESGSQRAVPCTARLARPRRTRKYASTSRFRVVPIGFVVAVKLLRPVPSGANFVLAERCTSDDPNEPPVREQLQGLPLSQLRPGESSWYTLEDRTFSSRQGRCDLRIELELADRSRKLVGRSCYSANTRSFRDGTCR